MEQFDLEEVGQTIERTHKQAREALYRRQVSVSEYMDLLYADNLEFVQPNGTLSRDEYGRQIFQSLNHYKSLDYVSHERISIEREGNEIVEVVRYELKGTATLFFLVVRKHHVAGESKVWWVNGSRGWKIRRVEIIKETNSLDGVAVDPYQANQRVVGKREEGDS